MIALIFSLFLTAHAQQETIWDVQAQKFISLDDLSAHPGEIFVFGEEHATPGSESDPETAIHHANQVRLIRQLQKQNTVSVGMEFLTYTMQDVVDQFVAGTLQEPDFLKQVGWGGNPFTFYREQILAARGTRGKTVALNIPQAIASHVAKSGKDTLTADELKLVPPFWERGNDSYFERFAELMKGHAPPDAVDRYFWAQSLWDDTMAWRTLEHGKQSPSDVFVIIVGMFHVQYGGGLPYELKKNGATDVKTVLQTTVPDWSDATLARAVQPDAKYGAVADYIWIHLSSEPAFKPMRVKLKNKLKSWTAIPNDWFAQ